VTVEWTRNGRAVSTQNVTSPCRNKNHDFLAASLGNASWRDQDIVTSQILPFFYGLHDNRRLTKKEGMLKKLAQRATTMMSVNHEHQT
jgi:hypothetical protein